MIEDHGNGSRSSDFGRRNSATSSSYSIVRVRVNSDVGAKIANRVFLQTAKGSWPDVRTGNVAFIFRALRSTIVRM